MAAGCGRAERSASYAHGSVTLSKRQQEQKQFTEVDSTKQNKQKNKRGGGGGGGAVNAWAGIGAVV